MNDLKTELVRNLVGFVVILAGVSVVGLGAHFHIDKEVDAGLAFFPAALLALQVKRGDASPKDDVDPKV